MVKGRNDDGSGRGKHFPVLWFDVLSSKKHVTHTCVMLCRRHSMFRHDRLVAKEDTRAHSSRISVFDASLRPSSILVSDYLV